VQLSYGAPLARASAIAHGLTRGGVGADIVVILAAQRGLDLLTGMIAVHDKALGPNHTNVGTDLNNLAEPLRNTKQF
jgi:hypothetical protein